MPPATIGDLQTVFGYVVGSAIYLAGAAVVVMLIVGGYQYLTAGGDKEGAQRAGKTITFAIGGLVLLLSSWIIMRLIGDFVGLDLSLFDVCLPGQSC